MRARRGVRDLADDLPGLRVREIEIDREEILLREVDHLRTVRAELRAKVEVAASLPLQDDAASELGRHLRRFGDRPERLELRRVPVRRELLRVDLQHGLDRDVVARIAAGRGAEHVPDGAVAVLAGDVRPQRLAVSIRKVLGVVELIDGRQLLAPRRLPHPHRGVRIDRADGEVLGHALDEPERQRQRAGRARAHVGAGDVVLERVDELVPEHVIARLDRPGERQDDTSFVSLCYAARPFAQIPLDRIGLPEVRATRIEDERLPGAQLMIQQLGQSRVPALRHAGGQLRGLLFLRVIVDIEVIGLQHLEVELLVLNLIAAEVAPLREGDCRHGEEEEDENAEKRGTAGDTFHGTSLKQRMCPVSCKETAGIAPSPAT